MKRMSKVIIAVTLLTAGGTLFAQNNPQGTEQSAGTNRKPGRTSVSITTKTLRPEELTISGKLSLVNGMIAMQSGGTTYYITGIDRLAGFIDGLQEGAEVTLKGFAIKTGKEGAALFRAGKLTINGRDYELVPRFSSDARQDEAGKTDADKDVQKKGSLRHRNFSRRFYFRNHPGMILLPGPGMMQHHGWRFNPGMRQKKQDNTAVPEEKK
ncbi:MAG: IpaC/SipC family type III secretion system effector [Treponema sp.]|jgi:hypothetical protein|nr:IpaC/SipC family type III secretion system effector [Treponema sp.]